LHFRALARRLPDTAVYSFAFRGLEQRGVPDQTIVAIARRNVAAMRTVDPEGPYRIFGYSFGGLVALAMAHQLADAGAELELLTLVEPSMVPGDRSRFEQASVSANPLEHGSHTAGPGSRVDTTLARASRIAHTGARHARHHLRLASAGVVERTALDQHDVFYDLHTRMLRWHRPRPYLGPVVVIATPPYLELIGAELDRVLPPTSRGGQRRDVMLGGTHLDLMREPNVSEVARVLDNLLLRDPV
jgi:thioesterase domain-containing protein